MHWLGHLHSANNAFNSESSIHGRQISSPVLPPTSRGHPSGPGRTPGASGERDCVAGNQTFAVNHLEHEHLPQHHRL